MKYLVFALLIIFPFGQLGRFEFQNFTIHLNDILACLVVAAWLFKKRHIPKSPLNKPLLFLLVAMLLSLLVNLFRFPAVELLQSSLYLLRFFVYAGLFFVVRELPDEHRQIQKFLEIGVLVVALAGLLQFMLLPDVSFLKASDWDDHYFRAVSTFLDPGFTGAILTLGLILAVLEKSWIRSAIIYLSFVLTYSRASYLMYLVSFGTISFYKKSFKIVAAAALVLALTLPVLPKSSGEGTKLARENSVTARLNNWKQSLEVWQKNPVFGVGFNTYKFVSKTSPNSHSGGADSSLLLVLATTGIIGFAAYANLLTKTWKMGDFVFKASLLGVIVHSMFNNTLFYPWIMEWLWILLALRSSAQTSKSTPA